MSMVMLLRGAERVWPTRNEEQPNGEGVASGGATNNIEYFHLHFSIFLLKCFCYGNFFLHNRQR